MTCGRTMIAGGEGWTVFHYLVAVLAVVFFFLAPTLPWKMLAVGVLLVAVPLFLHEFLSADVTGDRRF
ncbi:MAG: hypothetical protein IMX05_01940 [Hydrogenibacillus schlegelii]|nr:hypothetical protein [Hydrogenibacillus schlegelii]